MQKTLDLIEERVHELVLAIERKNDFGDANMNRLCNLLALRRTIYDEMGVKFDFSPFFGGGTLNIEDDPFILNQSVL